MRFAIVDIETTGGFPQQHGITEIAIVLHNGKEVEGRYETLVNPHQLIPPFIANMTGISDAMVARAPSFKEVAPKIYNLLKDRVFVAHNVNFHLSSTIYKNPAIICKRLSYVQSGSAEKYFLVFGNMDLGISAVNWVSPLRTDIVPGAMLWLLRKCWDWHYRKTGCW